MTLHQLKIFDTVATHLNITKAARTINVSQPTISKQLKLLEEEFRIRFYVNVGQGIKLTHEGYILWTAVRPILEQVEDLRNKLGVDSQPSFFSIGVSESPAASILPKLLRIFRRSHPTIHPIIRTGDSRAIEQMILTSRVEIGLITNTSGNSQITVIPVLPIKGSAVISPKHPLARKGKLSEDELVTAPLITRVGSGIASRLEQSGLKLNVVMECESSQAVRSAVECGCGIGLLYKDFVELSLKRGYLRAIDIPKLKDIRINILLAFRKGGFLSSNARNFFTLLRTSPNVKPEATEWAGAT